MNKGIYSLNELSDILDEVLSAGGTVTLTASGESMEPFIRDKRDNLTLIKKDEVSVGDIVLYKSRTGKLILHRIIAEENGMYILRGDNQWYTEKVKPSDIKAQLVSIEKNGRTHDCGSFYFRKYETLLPLIRAERRIKNSVKIRLHKLGENK